MTKYYLKLDQDELQNKFYELIDVLPYDTIDKHIEQIKALADFIEYSPTDFKELTGHDLLDLEEEEIQYHMDNQDDAQLDIFGGE